MTAQSIVCGACAAEVPNGRLSCPSCGELLASVSGSRRAGGSAASVAASAVVPPVLYDPATAPTGSVVDGQLSLEPSGRDAEPGSSWAGSTQTQAAGGALKATVNDGAAAEGLLDDDDDATGLPAWTPPSSSVPWGTASDLNGGRTPAYMPRPGLRPSPPQPTVAATADPHPADDASAWTGLGSEPAVLTEPGPALPAHPASAAVAQPEVSWPAPGPASPVRGPVAWPEPGAAAAMAAAPSASPTPATAVPAVQAAQVAQAAQPFDGPGAYLPPAPVTLPAGPSAPAREWAGHSAEATGNDAEAVSQTRSAIDADLRVRLLDFVKWLSVAGSAFAAVGFLLPWGQVVIGSADTGYFGRWGIAGPWHLLVALAILANLGLALIDNKVPVWIRTGITGLGLGALLLGLVWPYLTLPSLGAGPGAVIAAIGAAALVGSGILALVADRHAEPVRPV
jgi:hypothetical protein